MWDSQDIFSISLRHILVLLANIIPCPRGPFINFILCRTLYSTLVRISLLSPSFLSNSSDFRTRPFTFYYCYIPYLFGEIYVGISLRNSIRCQRSCTHEYVIPPRAAMPQARAGGIKFNVRVHTRPASSNNTNSM